MATPNARLLCLLPFLGACVEEPWANNADIAGAGSGRAFVAGYDEAQRGFVKELSGGKLGVVYETDGPLNGIWADSEGHAIAVGASGEVVTLSKGKWRRSNTDPELELIAVWADSPDSAVAVGNEGTVARKEGATWSEETSATKSQLRAVWGTSRDDVFAVGRGGTIIHFDGAAWSVMESGTKEDLNGVWGFGSDDVLAVGGSETTRRFVVLRYDGTEWRTELSGAPFALLGLDGDPETGDIYAVGAARRGEDAVDSTVLHFDGKKWTQSNPGIEEFLWDALVVPGGGCFVVGPGNTFAQVK